MTGTSTPRTHSSTFSIGARSVAKNKLDALIFNGQSDHTSTKEALTQKAAAASNTSSAGAARYRPPQHTPIHLGMEKFERGHRGGTTPNCSMSQGDEILWKMQWRDLTLACILREVRTTRHFATVAEIGHYELRVVRLDNGEPFTVRQFATREELVDRSAELQASLVQSGFAETQSREKP
jgi:hypothetical protein